MYNVFILYLYIKTREPPSHRSLSFSHFVSLHTATHLILIVCLVGGGALALVETVCRKSVVFVVSCLSVFFFFSACELDWCYARSAVRCQQAVSLVAPLPCFAGAAANANRSATATGAGTSAGASANTRSTSSAASAAALDAVAIVAAARLVLQHLLIDQLLPLLDGVLALVDAVIVRSGHRLPESHTWKH